MPEKILSDLIAVTQDNLEIEKIQAKANVENAKVRYWEKVEDVTMNIIKYVFWPLVLILAIIYLRG